MEGTVSVRYRVTLYADIDLASGQVARVFLDDESTRLDTDEEVVDFDLLPAQSAAASEDIVEQSFGPDAQPTPLVITPEMAQRAIEVAEAAEWPQWQIGA